MYTEEYFAKIKSDTLLRVILGLILIAAFLALVIVFTVLRLQIPQMAAAGVGFVLTYFVWYFKISPWTRYNRFMKEMRTGKKRTGVFTYEEIASETRMYDGVEVWDVQMNEGDNEEDKRLFVFDADMPVPEFRAGDRVEVTSYGRFVTEYKVL